MGEKGVWDASLLAGSLGSAPAVGVPEAVGIMLQKTGFCA